MHPIFNHAVVTFFYTDNNGNISDEEMTTRVTFAALPAAPGETTKYAASWVAPMDNFDRKTGRNKAEARLLRRGDKYTNEILVTSDRYVDFWTSVFTDAMDNSPCRWTVSDISFFKAPEDDEATPPF